MMFGVTWFATRAVEAQTRCRRSETDATSLHSFEGVFETEPFRLAGVRGDNNGTQTRGLWIPRRVRGRRVGERASQSAGRASADDGGHLGGGGTQRR